VRVISPDPLVNWSIDPSGFSYGVSSIAYVGGEYLIYMDWGSAMYFSTDLSSWEVVPLSAEERVRLVLNREGWYVAMANSTVTNLNTIWRSRDGRAWELVPTTLEPANVDVKAGAYGGGRFVMVGSGGDPQATYVLHSSGADATGWVMLRLPGIRQLYAIAYGADRFVAVGEGGTILTSNDGVTWSASISGTTARLNGVAYGGQAFAVVGENGTILKSLDGVQWTACLGGDHHQWQTVTWAEGRFVAMGAGGLMVRSDATTILDPLRLTPDGRLACGFAGVAGRTYRLERSEDLIHWTEVAAADGVHGPMEMRDPTLPTAACRYYRVLWTP